MGGKVLEGKSHHANSDVSAALRIVHEQTLWSFLFPFIIEKQDSLQHAHQLLGIASGIRLETLIPLERTQKIT